MQQAPQLAPLRLWKVINRKKSGEGPYSLKKKIPGCPKPFGPQPKKMQSIRSKPGRMMTPVISPRKMHHYRWEKSREGKGREKNKVPRRTLKTRKKKWLIGLFTEPVTGTCNTWGKEWGA